MKKLLPVLLALLVSCALVVPAMAAGEDVPGEPVPAESSAPAPEVTPTVTEGSVDVPMVSDAPVVTVPDEVTGSIFNFDLNFNGAAQPAIYTSSYMTLPPEEPREGLAGLVSTIFGSYAPRTYQVDTIVDGAVVDSVTQYVPGLAGLDYEWLSGVALFGVLLFCFLKMIGGLLK